MKSLNLTIILPLWVRQQSGVKRYVWWFFRMKGKIKTGLEYILMSLFLYGFYDTITKKNNLDNVTHAGNTVKVVQESRGFAP